MARDRRTAGFDFHTIDGERYWDERAYYAFTLEEIEGQIEAPTGEIDAMCLELVGRAVDDEGMLRRLKIPEAFWPLISESWHRDEASLYGRLDLSFDGRGRRNCWNTTRTRRPRSSRRRCFSGPGSNRRSSGASSRRADQFNSIHERLIEAWKKLGDGTPPASDRDIGNAEDAGTLAYLEDTASQAGLEPP